MKPVYFVLFISYYIMGAYATTDILRLLKGATVAIWHPNCYCPICGHKLRLTDQLPIISYLLSKGKCRYCATSIPISNLIPEVLFFFGFSLLSTLTDFQWKSFVLSIGTYETIKLIAIIWYGPREKDFLKNLFFSLLQNTIFFSILAFIFLVCQIA